MGLWANIDIDELSTEIVKGLENYTQDITDNLKEAVDIIGNEVNDEIKKHVNFRQPTGKYVKAFRVKTIFEDRYNKRNTWHVVNGQHRLTHLLENGHALRDGGRTRSYKHIKYGEELAQKRMDELAKEVIENAGH